MADMYAEGVGRFYGEYCLNVAPGASVSSDYRLDGSRRFRNCSVELVDVGRKGVKPHVVVHDASGKVVLDVGARASSLYNFLSDFTGHCLSEVSWVAKPSSYSEGIYLQMRFMIGRGEVPAVRDIDRVYLDTETTGLNPWNDEILQLSIVDASGGVLWDRKYKPSHTSSWREAQRVHHISPADVASCPHIEDDLAEIQSILDRAGGVYAFNAPFDFAFLGMLGLRADRSRGHDTMREYARAFHGRDFIKLADAARECSYRYNAHDSLADCRATLGVQARVDNYRERKAAKINWDDVPEPTRSSKKQETKTQARIYTALTWILLFLCAVLVATCFAAPYMLIVAIPTCFICRACFKHAKGMRERTGLSKPPHKGRHSEQQQLAENMAEPAAAETDEAEYERRLAMEATKTVRQQAEANPPAASASVPAVHIDEASVIPGDEPPMFMVRGSKVAKFKGDDGTDFTLYQHTIKCGREEHRLDGVEAVVEEGAALQSRFTATRIFLLGVFALAFKKRKGGEKWLGIMGPDFAWVSRADRKHIGDAMKFAAKVNDQARKQ